jgi:RNA polymerase sigma-70 factor (ECF subfamily)
MTDREIAKRVQLLLEAGDTRAGAAAAIEGLGPAVFGLLCALHGEDDAQDVFSAFAEDLWRGLPGFRWECSLRAWAFRIARNASHRFRRDPWRVRKERLRSSAASCLARSVSSASLRQGGDERIEVLGADLDPDDRALLVLRVRREMTWEEIAVALSSEDHEVTAAALRKRFERLKARMAAMARDKGLLP